jgi:hypothetical protein
MEVYTSTEITSNSAHRPNWTEQSTSTATATSTAAPVPATAAVQ